MRTAALLGARVLLGGYLGSHASQKLFGLSQMAGRNGVELPAAAEATAADA